jgi:2-dehydro-3-deoxygluconokinase
MYSNPSSNTLTPNTDSRSFGKGKILCFGELLLRLSPELQGQWIANNTLSAHIGGAELNVARALARWNVPVKYFSALPNNFITAEICQQLQAENIDISSIVFQGNRLGLYYLPQGTDLKQAGVVYDRAHSAFGELQPGTINWEQILEGCSWLHWSAITPGLNARLAAVCSEAIQAARKKGITISVDLNYRPLLWQYDVVPSEVMIPLVQQCDVVMGNIWAVEKLLGIPSPIRESKGHSQEDLVKAAGESMQQLHQAFPGVHHIAYTFRLDSSYFAVLYRDKILTTSSVFTLQNIVDKVGSGDCFMAALIYGIVHASEPAQIINRAAVAAIGKMKEVGDVTKQAIREIEHKIIGI